MTDYSKFSGEIMSLIFQKAFDQCEQSSEFLNYSLVCKNWERIAKFYISKNVVISDQTKFNRFIEWLWNTHMGHSVKSIRLDFIPKEEGAIEYIARYCKNLTKIAGSSFSTHSLWGDLGRISHCLIKLEYLPSISLDISEEYYACASNYKNSLKRLEFADSVWCDYGLQWLIEFTNEFTLLESLVFYTTQSTPCEDDLDIFLNHLHSLKELVLNGDRTRWIWPTLPSQPHHTLKALTITMTTEQSTLEYIKQKFPQLNFLKLTLYPSGDDHTIFLQQLKEYLPQLKDYNIQFVTPPEILPTIPTLNLIFQDRIHSPQADRTIMTPAKITVEANQNKILENIWKYPIRNFGLTDNIPFGQNCETLKEAFSNYDQMSRFEYIKKGYLLEFKVPRHSLTHLHLEAPIILPRVYETCSERLPYLSSLSIKTSHYGYFYMYMPYTHLKTLSLDLISKSSCSKIIIRTKTKSYIFGNGKYRSIYIFCKSLACIQIKHNGQYIYLK